MKCTQCNKNEVPNHVVAYKSQPCLCKVCSVKIWGKNEENNKEEKK